LYSLLQCHSQQAWDQTYDKWCCVVTSYSHGSLTDFYKIFESVASGIPAPSKGAGIGNAWKERKKIVM